MSLGNKITIKVDAILKKKICFFFSKKGVLLFIFAKLQLKVEKLKINIQNTKLIFKMLKFIEIRRGILRPLLLFTMD